MALSNHERRKTQATLGLEAAMVAALKLWREVVTPHSDVASSRLIRTVSENCG